MGEAGEGRVAGAGPDWSGLHWIWASAFSKSTWDAEFRMSVGMLL